MIILKNVYEQLINLTPIPPPEYGGIIGIENEVISVYHLDMKNKQHHCCYIPTIQSLNSIIRKWASNGITFGGIFHTHFSECENLSDGDIVYIRKIMCNMPQNISELYFPLIFPGEKIISYKTVKDGENIIIISDNITIV